MPQNSVISVPLSLSPSWKGFWYGVKEEEEEVHLNIQDTRSCPRPTHNPPQTLTFHRKQNMDTNPFFKLPFWFMALDALPCILVAIMTFIWVCSTSAPSNPVGLTWPWLLPLKICVIISLVCLTNLGRKEAPLPKDWNCWYKSQLFGEHNSMYSRYFVRCSDGFSGFRQYTGLDPRHVVRPQVLRSSRCFRRPLGPHCLANLNRGFHFLGVAGGYWYCSWSCYRVTHKGQESLADGG
jgi:hypothetical protein